jgi:hypothetical protein
MAHFERKSTIFTKIAKYETVWSCMSKTRLLELLEKTDDDDYIDIPIFPGGASEEEYVAFRRDQINGVEDYR